MLYTKSKPPKMSRSLDGIANLSASLPQNMTIRPRVKQAKKVIKPKINKNRLWGDFCLELSL